ncbi:FecR domain-containing protein [Dyella halodurans]|uniref:FecR domain-containing protein n=1 Tax=Dyella halodurans TaxID=1920171 RepID=A0ABV9BX12_9GAMM|nr:FecR domain-containing protein [Dyella halodurans]
MFLLTAFASTFAPTLPAAPADWNYRVRPGDNLWDLAGRYMKPDVPWQTLQDYNQVGDPLHLPPGITLRVPVAWLRLQPAPARVLAIIGVAEAKVRASLPAVPVTQGMSVGYGTELVTQHDASLTLELADGSRVLMQSDSELVLDRLSEYGRTGMVDTRMRLKRGRVSTDVRPLTGSAARFTISTPNTLSSVRGTHFRVVADADQGMARTEVVSGRVDVGNDKRHVLVSTGTGVATASGASPGQLEALLSAPEMDCPRQPIGLLPGTIRWKPLAGAGHYRIQVASTDKFEALVMDQVVDGPQASLPSLADGPHALRVRGIRSSQLEGLDAICSFVIAAHPQPPLIIEPQPGTKVRGTRPGFRWTENEEAASYAWQLSDDASFDHVLDSMPTVIGDRARTHASLPYGRYYWRIASRDQHGKLGPFTEAIAFELVAEPPAPQPGVPRHQHGDLVLSWPAGSAEQRYRIQLARKPDFADPAVDQMLDQPQLNLTKLSSGKWYVRVQTIDTDGYAGPWGAVQRTRVPCAACRWVAAGGGAALLWLVL